MWAYVNDFVVAYEEAVKSENRPFVYCASKSLAERAAWDDKDHKFAITSICPRRSQLVKLNLALSNVSFSCYLWSSTPSFH